MISEDKIKVLIEKAMEMRANSYCLYSNYAVGAALLCEGDEVVGGCNVENASFGGTICAERSAVSKAISDGKRSFFAIAIVGGPASKKGVLPKSEKYAFPCGICRQVLREFSNPATFQVIMARGPEDYESYMLEELLPLSFGPEHLN
ncbi:MAG: cytidine deaminase [Lachnospiraceae bacterium]|nr:cytidine deaminase [Lachnospiraceae bacterium]